MKKIISLNQIMQKKYEIKKTVKNSLSDILDIRKKNIKTEYWKDLESEQEDSNKKIKIKIYYEDYQKIVNDTFTEITVYINKLFVKFNYSPIIDKIFPLIKKESDDNIENLNHIWRHYMFETNRIIHKFKSDTYSKKIITIFANFINLYLSHIFSIPKIADSLNILNKKITFKIYDFADEKEEKNIYLDIERELKGNGCTFIFLKELRRLFDDLFFTSNCLKNNLFYFFFHGVDTFTENIFYKYVIENEVVSSLLYQIKILFEQYSVDDKDVVNFINKYTIDIKKDLKQDEYEKKINDIYNNPEFDKRVDGLFHKEYEEIDKYNLDIMPTKVNYVYKKIKDLEKDYKLNGDEIDFKEDEKVKEITDLDELAKYIQGDPKKKKKKKKKKDNPINMLEKMNLYNNNLEDDQMSIVSHDTIFSNFKADIRKDNIEDENIIKIKPAISDKFIENLK